MVILGFVKVSFLLLNLGEMIGQKRITEARSQKVEDLRADQERKKKETLYVTTAELIY